MGCYYAYSQGCGRPKGLGIRYEHLFPVVQKLADGDGQLGDILEGIFLAAKAHPGLVCAEYLRFEYGDTHRARRLAREFIDTVLARAAQSDTSTLFHEGAMQTQQQLKTAQDYLDAADREFEDANALAGTENLWAAITHTLKAVADKNGWDYDADDLYPVVEKVAKMDEQVGEVLLSSYGAAEGYPNLVRAGYLRIEDGDTHWARRVAHEFIGTVKEMAG